MPRSASSLPSSVPLARPTWDSSLAFPSRSSLTVTLLGLAAGPMFALSAVGFGRAILRREGGSYVMAATLTVFVGLILQSVLLTAYLRLRDPQVLAAIVRAWRPSLVAGFM